MAEDPKKKIKDLNEELGYFEDQVLSIADLLSKTIKDAIEDIRDASSGVADIFEKRLTKSIRDFSKSSDAILSNQVKIYQGSIKDRDVQKSLNTLLLKKLAIERNMQVLKANGIEIEARAAEELEEAYKAQYVLLKAQQKEAERISHNMGVTGAIIKGISKIPILGNFLDAEAALEASQAAAAKSGGNRIKVLGAGFKQLGASMLKNLTDPLILLGTFVKIFKFLLDIAFEYSKRTAEIARNFGIISSEAKAINASFSNITLSSKNLLVNQNSLAEAMFQINDRLGTSSLLTESMLEDQIELTKKLGLTAEEAAVFAEYSILTGESQESIVNSIGRQNKGNLSNKKIFQEVAKIGGQLAAQYKNNPKLIAQAVIQAQKLGLSLEQAQKMSRGLLDFEESITAELEAELLTGMDLNLEKARYLALQGKSAEAAALLMKEAGGFAKFQSLIPIQQDAIARSIGLSADELADAYRTQEAINRLKPIEKKAYEDAIKLAKEKGDFEAAAELEKQMLRGKSFELAKLELDNQQKLNEALNKAKAIFSAMVEGDVDKLVTKFTNFLDLVLRMPGMVETLKSAGKIAAIITGGLFIASLARLALGATPLTAMWVRMAGGMPGTTRPTTPGTSPGSPKPSSTRGPVKPSSSSPTNARYRPGGSIRPSVPTSKPPRIGRFGGPGGFIGMAASMLLPSLLGPDILQDIEDAMPTWMKGKSDEEIEKIQEEYRKQNPGIEPKLATGGIVTRPTRAIVGEAGPEAVVPLSKLLERFDKMTEKLSAIENYTRETARKEGKIYLGPTQVGTAQTVGTYKAQ